jgi:D-3-phosphoglycerate dehydrogenase
MFNLARSLHDANRKMPEKGDKEFKSLKKAYSNGIQLRGKTLGVVGFGRIGQEVARLGVALGMNVLPVDLVVEEADIDINVYFSERVRLSVNLETAEWEEVLENSDFITLHVPFSGGTPIIGGKEIEKMKQGAFVINTARGGAVDEDALLEALNSGKLAGAGLDVYDREPTPKRALLEHSKISLSPHIGASTVEAQANIGLELADKIIAFFGDDK